jgi:hypothetical protein
VVVVVHTVPGTVTGGTVDGALGTVTVGTVTVGRCGSEGTTVDGADPPEPLAFVELPDPDEGAVAVAPADECWPGDFVDGVPFSDVDPPDACVPAPVVVVAAGRKAGVV